MPARERALVYLNTEKGNGKIAIEKLAILLHSINTTNVPFWLSDESGLILTIEQATQLFGQSLRKPEVLGNRDRPLGRKKLLFAVGRPPVYTPEDYFPTEMIDGREVLQRATRFQIIDKLNAQRLKQGEVQYEEYILEEVFVQEDQDEQQNIA